MCLPTARCPRQAGEPPLPGLQGSHGILSAGKACKGYVLQFPIPSTVAQAQCRASPSMPTRMRCLGTPRSDNGYGTFYRSGECTLKAQQLAADRLPTWYARGPQVRAYLAASPAALSQPGSWAPERVVRSRMGFWNGELWRSTAAILPRVPLCGWSVTPAARSVALQVPWTGGYLAVGGAA